MPELPDITAYVDALRPRTLGRRLARARVRSVFLVRTFDPPLEDAEGRRVVGVERLGKRIVFALEGDLYLVVHLMIAGRFLWKPLGAPARSKVDLAAFDFEGPAADGAEGGTLVIYEAGTKKRAAVHLVRGRDTLAAHHRGGIDVFTADAAAFSHALRRENHTVKRSLTDPRLIDGVGNAYSDEILHAARLSPLRLTSALTDDEIARLRDACRSTLTRWTDELRREFGIDPARGEIGRFPGVGEITAFRPGFAVHGRFGKPCPVCATPVQRIIYAENETNYCPTCQTGGRVLADRSMSRLLKDDWPRSVEELEEM
jgi:formamidopyrimidine-DNA glycosylase